MKKHISVILALILILSCLAPCALARGQYLGYQTVVNCDNWVTLRRSASTSAASVAKVPLGATVEVYAYNSQFAECYYLGMHGYILTAYLSGGDDDYMGEMYVVNCNEFVTLRKHPSTSAASVTKVAKGQKVDAYYYNSTFARCTYRGMEGYILLEYLSSSPASTRGSYMGTMTVTNCDSWVTLRSAPSTKAGTVTRVPRGDTVEAYRYDGQFAECYYSGLHGYILLKYLG